jgi:hypothetical protein
MASTAWATIPAAKDSIHWNVSRPQGSLRDTDTESLPYHQQLESSIACSLKGYLLSFEAPLLLPLVTRMFFAGPS